MYKPWSKWSLEQWLSNLEDRAAQEIQLGLTRIRAVTQRLKLQNPDSPVITVAGTNGKGSTVTALETVYHHSGYRVGAYTSPHLLKFNERIRVNLLPIPDVDLCQAFGLIEEVREGTILTYFEMTTLAALMHFKEQNLDVIILEVGLGGRLDATNIVDADLSIITTIDFDHQDYLGDTLEAIAYEKAGIIREGKPFIYADSNPPGSITDVVKKLNASSNFYGKDYTIQEHRESWEFSSLQHKALQLPKPQIQLKSAAAAIMACSLLSDKLPVSPSQLQQSMNMIHIAGRLQLHQGTISILYDVSHNPQSARLLAKTIRALNVRGRVFAVFSALKDKDILGLILPLKDCVSRWYPAQLDNKRSADAKLLLSMLRDAEIFVEICYTNPLNAFETALNQAQPDDLIVVYGSFFTVSHVMAGQHQIL